MILVFGHINTHFYTGLDTAFVRGSRNITANDSMLDVGGSSAMQAVSAARGGAKVSMIGTIGNDVLGKHCLETFRREGINTSGIAKSKTDTGIEISFTSPTDEVTTIVSHKANRHSNARQIPETHLNERSLLLLSDDTDEVILTTLLKRTKERNGRSVLCLQHNKKIGTDTLILADIIITDETIINIVGNKNQDRASTVVITKQFGISGASAISNRGNKSHYYAPESKNVDTNGCFDVFCGFFAACIQAGLPLERAITFASKASHAASQKTGIYNSIPYLGYIEDIENKDKPKTQNY